ncbi:MAG: hypothetical protein HYU24_06585 [Candidatus Rokubacteria bacterium]|nr:hypothetical protein [Candidatus Rokubacteria bacterium]
MDLVTHGLTGFVVARAATGRVSGWDGAAAAGAVQAVEALEVIVAPGPTMRLATRREEVEPCVFSL